MLFIFNMAALVSTNVSTSGRESLTSKEHDMKCELLNKNRNTSKNLHLLMIQVNQTLSK